MLEMTCRSLLLGVAAALTLVSGIAVAGPPTPTTMQIQVLPSSIPVGGTATVTATATPNTGTINCGKGHIQYDINSTGWLNLANNLPVALNQFSAVFDTSVITVVAGDLVRFRAGYESTGSGCEFENQAIGQSPTTTLLISGANGVCPNDQTTGVYIAIAGPDGNGAPAPGTHVAASFDVLVTACEDVFDLTAQGGANGWAPVKSTIPGSPTIVVRNANKKNEVYLWTIGAMLQGDVAKATVYVEGDIKNSLGECGKIKKLNGDWSALYATTSGGPKTKSDYTVHVAEIEVTCP
jgi:hypothetical protein